MTTNPTDEEISILIDEVARYAAMAAYATSGNERASHRNGLEKAKQKLRDTWLAERQAARGSDDVEPEAWMIKQDGLNPLNAAYEVLADAQMRCAQENKRGAKFKPYPVYISPQQQAAPNGWKIRREESDIFPVRIEAPDGSVWYPECSQASARLALAMLSSAPAYNGKKDNEHG